MTLSSSIDEETEDKRDSSTKTEKTLYERQQDAIKQFKRSIFKPVWKSPHLNSKSTAVDYFKHAFFICTGKHSDQLKGPLSINPFIGLMLQLLKLDDPNLDRSKETFFSLFEFLKLPLLKPKQKAVNANRDEIDIIVLDKNSCPVKNIIMEGGDINQLENSMGLFPSPIEVATLLFTQFSQFLRHKGRNHKKNAKVEHKNTTPFLEFVTNLKNRSVGSNKYTLEDTVENFYRILDIIFYFTVRLWVEIAALITAPLWQLAKTIVAGIVLTITFPIWYPITRAYYSRQDKTEKNPSPDENITIEDSEESESEAPKL